MRTLLGLVGLGPFMLVMFYMFAFLGKTHFGLIVKNEEKLNKHYRETVMKSFDESQRKSFTVIEKSFNKRAGITTRTTYNLILEKDSIKFYVEVPMSVHREIEESDSISLNYSVVEEHNVFIYENKEGENVVLQITNLVE